MPDGGRGQSSEPYALNPVRWRRLEAAQVEQRHLAAARTADRKLGRSVSFSRPDVIITTVTLMIMIITKRSLELKHVLGRKDPATGLPVAS